jgi:hypothetical protein
MSKRARRREIRRLQRFERLHASELEAANKRADRLSARLRRLQVERDSLADKLRQLISPIEVARVEERAMAERSRLVAPVHIGPDGYWTVG